MRAFIVPNGCSTVPRRCRMAWGLLSRRLCTSSITCSCSQRVIRRSDILCTRGDVGELCPVRACVRHLMCDDQVMVGIDRNLHIVADDAGPVRGTAPVTRTLPS